MSKSVIILGGGASVKEGIALGLWNKIKEANIEIWSINFAFMTMPYLPHRELFLDISFFRKYIIELQKLNKQGVKLYTKKHSNFIQIPEINTYNCTRNINQANDLDKIFIGNMGLSGIFALSLACKEKYNNIYLLGFDYGTAEIKNRTTHYYQEKLKVESKGFGRWDIYRDRNGNVNRDVKDFEVFLSNKDKIYNVSPNSLIPYFKKLTYEELFECLKK